MSSNAGRELQVVVELDSIHPVAGVSGKIPVERIGVFFPWPQMFRYAGVPSRSVQGNGCFGSRPLTVPKLLE